MAKRANNEGSIYKRPRTRKDGSTYVVWESSIRFISADGKSKRKSFQGKTQAEVKEKLEKFKLSLASGVASGNGMTVAQLLDRYYQSKRFEVEPETLQDYQDVLERCVRPYMGTVVLDKVKAMHVQGLKNHVASEISAKYANRCLRYLSYVFNQAIVWELMQRNPCKGVKPHKTEKKQKVIWEPQEMAFFLEVTKDHPMYAAFYLLASTGLRRGELLGLRWVDLSGEYLHIRQNLVEKRGKSRIKSPKTQSSQRIVYLAKDVIEVLAEHRDKQAAQKQIAGHAWVDHGLIFPNGLGKPFAPRNLLRLHDSLQNKAKEAWLNRIDDEALVETSRLKLEKGELFPHMSLHDFRHYHASVLILIERKNDVEVASRLGHSDISTTKKHYTHMFDLQRTLLGTERENDAPSLLKCFELLRSHPDYVSLDEED